MLDHSLDWRDRWRRTEEETLFGGLAGMHAGLAKFYRCRWSIWSSHVILSWKLKRLKGVLGSMGLTSKVNLAI